MANTINAASYGATGNGVTDDTAALQAALTAAQAGRLRLELDPGTYRTSAPLVVEQGGASKRTFDMDGFGAVLLPTHSGWTIEVRTLSTYAESAIGQGSEPISMRNFTILGTSGSTSTHGIIAGRQGFHAYMLSRPTFLENVMIEEVRGIGMVITNFCHFDINRFVQRNHVGSAGVQLLAQDDRFTGDITFNDSQFQGLSAAGRSLTMYAGNPSAGAGVYSAQLRGIRFNSCVFYGGYATVRAGRGGLVADTWFNDCAWDSQDSAEALEVYCGDGGQLNKVFVTDPYMVGYKGKAVYLRADAGALVNEVTLRGGGISFTAEPIYASNFAAFKIDGMSFYGCTVPWSIINIDAGCRDFQITGNRASTNTATNLIAVGGSTRYQVANNMSQGHNCLFDYSGAVPKDIATGNVSF